MAMAMSHRPRCTRRCTRRCNSSPRFRRRGAVVGCPSLWYAAACRPFWHLTHARAHDGPEAFSWLKPDELKHHQAAKGMRASRDGSPGLSSAGRGSSSTNSRGRGVNEIQFLPKRHGQASQQRVCPLAGRALWAVWAASLLGLWEACARG